MKKITFLIIFVFLVLISVISPVKGETVLYTETWDNYTANGYTKVTTDCVSGNCTKHTNAGSDWDFDKASVLGLNVNSSHEVNFYAKVESALDDRDKKICLSNECDIPGATFSNGSVTEFQHSPQKFTYYESGTPTDTGITYNVSTWYKFRYVLYPENNTYDWYIYSQAGDNLIYTGTGLSFYVSVPRVNELGGGFADVGITEGIYFDELQVNSTEVIEDSPIMTLTSTANNTNFINYENYFYNYSATFTNENTDLANCSFYHNDALEETVLNLNLTKTHVRNISFSSSGHYNLTFNCSNYETSDSLGYYYFRVDLGGLGITLSPDINGTVFNTTDTFLANITFTDAEGNGIAYNVSFFKSDGTLWTFGNMFYNDETTRFSTISNISTKTLESSDIADNITLITQVWDSHTNIIIPNYEWEKYVVSVNDKTYKGIRFNNNVFNLSTDNYNKVNDFALIKKPDRFLFGFNFTEKDFMFTMFLGSRKEIKYLPTSNYKGHFIVNLKHWVDFESDDIEDLQIDYLENYDVWRIRFVPKKKIVVFNSIGDLNYLEKRYYFDVQEKPSADTVLLQQILAESQKQTDYQKQQLEGVNMIWFWALFGFALVLPFVLKKEGKVKDHVDTLLPTLFSVMIFLILFYFNGILNYFSLVAQLQNVINLILWVFILGYMFIFPEIDF